MLCSTTTVLSDSTTGGTWRSADTTLATINTLGLVTGMSGGTDTIFYTVTNFCNTATAIKLLNINATSLWTGTTSTNWGDSSNWSTNVVPTSMVNATIPAGTTFSPQIITGNYSTKDISLESGSIVTLNSGTVLHIKGDLSNDGRFTGAGVLSLDTNVSQTISGTGPIKNFELNNTAGATIQIASRMTVDSLLTITAGTLYTNDSLVIYSDSVNTGRVAPIPASGAAISGNVKVMQYIPGGLRRYRFWSHPFSNYIGLSQVQQYIDVTGSGGISNGFTTTGSNAPSAYRYNPLAGNDSLPSDPGWKPFASTTTTIDSNRLHQYQGIRLFLRGRKGEGLGYGSYTPSPTTVAQWGLLNQGTQSVGMTKGTRLHQDYNMIGNPFASPVDIGTVMYNAKLAGRVAGSAFYIWNPYLGAAGQFQAMFINTATPVPYFIQANCAFQVRTMHDGDTLTFSESNKGSNASANLLRGQSLHTMLTIYDAQYHPWDMLQIRFSESASDNEDDEDATKPLGAEFNFYSLSANEDKLAIDARRYTAKGIIPLGVSSIYAQDYIIKSERVAAPVGAVIYLHDKLLNQYIRLTDGAEYRFSVTKDAATQGNNRFELSIKQADELAATSNGLEVTMTPNPATNEVTVSFRSSNADDVQFRILDLKGVSVCNRALGVQKAGIQKITLNNLASGVYMVELTSGTEKVVQRLIKE